MDKTKENQKFDIFLSMPSNRGGLSYEVSESLGGLISFTHSKGYRLPGYPGIEDSSILPYNRCAGVHKAKELGAKYILFIDDDMIAPPESLVQLIQDDVDIVSGLCVGRSAPYMPTAGTWDGNKFKSTRLFDGTTYEVDRVGTGFLLVKMSVFHRLKWPYFQFEGINAKTNKWIGEDWYFCKLAQKAGFKIHVNSGVIIGHLHKYAFTVRDHVRFVREYAKTHDSETKQVEKV